MKPRFCFVLYVCLAGAALLASRASAQDAEAPPEGRFRLGPLRFTPSIVFSNLGVDTNVFNEEVNPKQDTTAAVGPAVDLFMHAGPTRVSGKLSAQYLYFGTYENQRAWNTDDQLKWEWKPARVSPFVAGTYSNTKERPGYEIDSRARLRSDSATAGTSLSLGPNTTLVLSGTRAHYSFEQGETFLGFDLARALNRTSDTEEAQLRLRLTSLTTLVVNGDAVQDRFTFDPLRNSHSVKVMPGFELKPSALISGKVFVGYRQFTSSNAAVPDHQGLVATVDAQYVAGPTRIQTRIARDLAYSYEPTDPYYALTDLNLILTERITRKWELVGRGGRQTLDYQRLKPLASLGARSDVIDEGGGGVGYRLGPTLRLGFDAVYFHRTSTEFDTRQFDGLRYGASVTYGLPQ